MHAPMDSLSPPPFFDSVFEPTVPNPAGPPNFLLHIFIDSPRDSAITRLLSVPASLTAWDLHCAIERAFQWSHSDQYGLELLRYGDASEGPRVSHFSNTANSPLADVCEVPRDGSRSALQYRHGRYIVWVIHVMLVGRAKEPTNGKIFCLSGKGHPPTEDTGVPQDLYRCIETYNNADSIMAFRFAQGHFTKSMPNRAPNGKSAAGPWNWNKKSVDTALKRLPVKHTRKRRRSDESASKISREVSIKPEPFLAGLSFVIIGTLCDTSFTGLQQLIRRHGGEVTIAPNTRTSFVVLGLGVQPRKLQIVQDSQLETLTERELHRLILSKAGSTQTVPKLRDGREPNYLVRVELDDTAFPVIHRILSCPVDFTFHDFHLAIQVAFHWTNQHAWQFHVLDPRLRFPWPVLNIMDEGMDMSIQWRKPPVRGDAITLKGVFDADAYKAGKVVYTYDFGDRWEHNIEVIGRANTATENVVCIDGEGHPAGEDIGGTSGWGQVQEAHLAPAAAGSEERNKQKEWLSRYEECCANADSKGQKGFRGDGFWRWDIDEVNSKLTRLEEIERSG